MMNSKRIGGSRLLVVIALFGILSTFGISAANNQVTDDVSTEESSEPTTVTIAAGDQSTVDGTSSETEKVTETSVGDTTASTGGSQPGGAGGDQTGITVGEISIAGGGGGTVETPTSDGESSTADTPSAGVESSAGRTDGETTAATAVKEATSAGATGTEKQVTEGETTATFTGASSTNETEDELQEAKQQDETTGATTADESTTSVQQTSKEAGAQYTTNVGDTSAERQTETTATIKVTVAADSSTIAPTYIDDLPNAATAVVKNITSGSGENSAQISVESITASGITSIVAKNDIIKEDSKPVSDGTQTPRPNVWDAHRGIFLTIVIIISVCVVVTGFCCLCMKWRERGSNRNPEKHPIAMEEAREAPTAVSNPIPDHEMIQDEAPMQERENPAVTPNGGGQHISKADEDNGWVVPLDELSNAEKEKPEVENTRL